ncbi:MAG: hypothetical protein ACRDPR_11870, partial [Nocardioidaceae bacterium]
STPRSPPACAALIRHVAQVEVRTGSDATQKNLYDELCVALVVHRAQGATVDVAHRFEDGGGRELAYVAMSRARAGSHSWLAADDLDQAKEDLIREWSTEARARWVIDTGAPDHRPSRRWVEPERILDRAKLDAERHALLSAIPPDPRSALLAAYRELDRLAKAERELETGDGTWRGTRVGRAASWIQDLRDDRVRCEGQLGHSDVGWRERRRLRSEIERSARAEQLAAREFDQLAAPHRLHLAARREGLQVNVTALNQAQTTRNDWLEQHPEAEHRLGVLNAQLNAATQGQAAGRELERTSARQMERRTEIEPLVPAVEVDLGLDLGL